MPRITVNKPIEKTPRLLRVAAYARVSTGKDAMVHSLAAQVDYYSQLIRSHKGWEYVGVYADQAVTGTKDTRPEFQRLLDDSRAGKIDMVITKSVSRLARNTVLTLSATRELKALGVDIFFEKENIHSTSGEGELILTLIASIAQEESRSVSENCKWSIRERFKKGIPPHFRCYGYKWVGDQLQIVPEEAAVVRRIFLDYLSGKGADTIVSGLTAEGVPTRDGKKWSSYTIYYILRNERYIGDLLLQKKFVTDHISKKQVRNQGELPQYYVTEAHDPIVSHEVFGAVQQEIERRRSLFSPNCTPPKGKAFPFSGIMTCCNCGNHYRRKINNAGTKYELPVWICRTFNQRGRTGCMSKQIPENILLDTITGVLDLPRFDEGVFREMVDHIDVTGPNQLRVFFKDGRCKNVEWQDRSRKNSWTPEMRKQAAAYARKGGTK